MCPTLLSQASPGLHRLCSAVQKPPDRHALRRRPGPPVRFHPMQSSHRTRSDDEDDAQLGAICGETKSRNSVTSQVARKTRPSAHTLLIAKAHGQQDSGDFPS